MPADVAVIGLGHHGLPLAQAAAAAGFSVVGYDPDPRAVDALAAGRPPVGGSLTAAEVRRLLTTGFRPSADPADLGGARTAVICVPTPLADDGALDLGPVADAARELARHLKPRTTVLLESAAYPGSTEDLLRPLLQQGSGLRAGRDFHLAYSPGPLDPADTAPAPKVVGGLTPGCTEAAVAFYGRFTERVVRARGPREAETVRLLEGNVRHVNFALVNELAWFCHDRGIDLWDVVRCAETRPFGTAHSFRPGPGVGGHGVPVDPGRVPVRVPHPGGRTAPGFDHPLRMVDLAREVNGRMPRYVVQRSAQLLNEHGKSARGARVLLLGVTYEPDVADLERTPAGDVAARLTELGARVGFHDPYVTTWQVLGRPVPRAAAPYDAAADADLTVLLQPHRTYDLQALAVKAQLLLDTRGATPPGAAHRL